MATTNKWAEMAKSRGREARTAPLPSSLKKTSASSIGAKWNAYIEAIGLREPHPLHNSKYTRRGSIGSSGSGAGSDPRDKRVHFPAHDAEIGEEFERPATTDDEKASYHYSATELCKMMSLGKQLAQCASRFAGLPDDTIYEQGYLTLPVHNVFVHHKRFYCLLKKNQLLCYSSPAHAAKNTGLKSHLTIIQVQDVQKLSMQKKIARFGAHLPQEIALMLLVTKSSGELVTLTAESKMSKRNWLHTLRKLTEVVESRSALSSSSDESATSSPADKKQKVDECSPSTPSNTTTEEAEP